MDNGFVYRKLNASDIDSVVRMETDFRSGFIVRENAERFLRDPMNWLIACLSGDRIIGFAYGYELNRLNGIGNMVYIHEVGVLPEYQRRGIGTELLRTIKRLCKSTGVCRFFLFTERSNIGACSLYGKMKGEEAHTDDVAYFFNDLDE